MKKFYLTLIFLILFLSSCDNRLFIATSFVEDSLELQDIDVLSTIEDLYPFQSQEDIDENTMNKLISILEKAEIPE